MNGFLLGLVVEFTVFIFNFDDFIFEAIDDFIVVIFNNFKDVIDKVSIMFIFDHFFVVCFDF